MQSKPYAREALGLLAEDNLMLMGGCEKVEGLRILFSHSLSPVLLTVSIGRRHSAHLLFCAPSSASGEQARRD